MMMMTRLKSVERIVGPTDHFQAILLSIININFKSLKSVGKTFHAISRVESMKCACLQQLS